VSLTILKLFTIHIGIKNAAYVDAIIEKMLGKFLRFFSLLDEADLVVVL